MIFRKVAPPVSTFFFWFFKSNAMFRYIFLAVCFLTAASFHAQSQTQRLVLFEEFTGENCPPCASSNPALNVLLDANAAKIVSIKYQVDIPFGSPPLFSYNKPEVNAASDYYGITGAPTGYMDGNAWSGGVSSFTATHINNRYALPAPFSVSVSHVFSGANAMMHTHTVIRATEAVVGLTQLRAKIVVTEKEINGPATFNGEKRWQHVMRKLLPDFGGVALPANWAVGDSVVLDEEWMIAQPPSPSAGKLPDWRQLEVVSFVQNEATKEVLQTGFSPAQTVSGILEQAEILGFLSISPNPASDEIQFSMPENSGAARWEIHSIDGETIQHGVFSGTYNLEKINVGQFLAGVYLLKAGNDAGIQVGKFVKN